MKIVALVFAAAAVAFPLHLPSLSLSKRQCTPQDYQGADTATGIVDHNCCADITLIYARGTSEPGNVGQNVGPTVWAALAEKVGASNILFQGVNYNADLLVGTLYAIDGHFADMPRESFRSAAMAAQ